jgi:prolyl oligopeptidase
MKKIILIMVISSTMASFGQNQKPNSITYPVTKTSEQLGVFYDTKSNDPYQWLEDDKSAATIEWVKEENKVTFDYLSKIPFRNTIKQRMEKLWNFEKVSAPWVTKSIYFIPKRYFWKRRNFS